MSKRSHLFLIVFAGFFSLSSTFLDGSRHLKPVQVCPYLGDLQPKQIPSQSILSMSGAKFGTVLLLSKKGEKLSVPETWVRKARYIKTQEELDSFLSLYSSICGGKPPYLHLIASHQERNLRGKESLRHSKLESQRFAGSLKHSWKDRLEKRKQVANRIEKMKSDLARLDTPHFQILGKVLSIKGNDLIVYGSSFPKGARNLDTPGFVYNEIIIIQNYKKSDIVSPPDFVTRHVQAEDLVFVGHISQDSIPVTIFRHFNKSDTIPKVQKLKNQIREEMALLSELY